MSPHRVDVIIPVLNGGPRFRDCVAAALAQTDVEVEVIVVDNGSTDDSVGVATALGATVLHEPVRSAYAARNRGVRASTAPFVAFTDADCIPAPDWLARGTNALLGHDLIAGAIEQLPGT